MDHDPNEPDRSGPEVSGQDLDTRAQDNAPTAPQAQHQAQHQAQPQPGPAEPGAAGSEPTRRDGNRNNTGAVVLIVVGIVLLAGQGFGGSLDNWWALFILIPAIGALSTAYRAYQRHNGEFYRDVTGPGITGLILLAVTAIFLFDLSWNLMGGVVVILIGAGMLLRRR